MTVRARECCRWRIRLGAALVGLFLSTSGPVAGAGTLRAGAAVAAIDVPAAAPLAGYGDRGPGNHFEGVRSPVEARALVVESLSEGDRIGIVTLDVLIIWPGLRAAVAASVSDLGFDRLLVTATHTHSGPGGYVDQWIAELGIMGWYREAILLAIVRAADGALRQAAAHLEPARLGSGSVSLHRFSRNRRQVGGPTEPRTFALRIDSEAGAPLATVFALAAHPIVLSPQNRALSAGYPGRARQRVEDQRGGGVALFLAGPLGDQNPMPPGGKMWGEDPPLSLEGQLQSMHEMGDALGDAVAEAVQRVHPSPTASLSSRSVVWDLPDVNVRIGCVGYLLGPILHCSARRSLSRRARIDVVQLGDLRILGSPFELGVEVAAAIRQRSPGPLLVAAHVNDWLGYLLLPEDHAQGGYETCLGFHGRDVALGFIEQALDALGEK